MNSKSSNLKRGLLMAIFGTVVLAFGGVIANAQYGGGYENQGSRHYRRDNCRDQRGHQERRQNVYYGNSGYNNNGYYDNNGYNNNGYYNNRGYSNRGSYNRRGSVGLSTIFRVVLGGGRGNGRYRRGY